MTKNVKFGILGCGMIASVHANAIKNIENATLVGVADNNLEIAQKFAQKHGIEYFGSFIEMLKMVDAVCICTPSFLHADNAITALKQGKHVVVEKPMALSVEDADRVIEESKKANRFVTVISQLRFSNDVQRLKKVVEEGLLGKISLCTLTMKYYRSKEYFASSSWKGKLAYDGGGALMNQGIHGVDLMQYIMGGVKNTKGKIATLCHNIEVEDTAVAIVEFNNGALGTIVASTCATPGFDRKLEIHGDKGYAILTENNLEKLVIDGKECEVGVFEKSNTASDPTAVASLMHQQQIENLIHAINGEEEIFIDCNEGKKAVKIITDIYKE